MIKPAFSRMRRVFAAVLVLCVVPISVILAFGPGSGGSATDCGSGSPPVTNCQVVGNKELMITNTCVVDDPIRTKWFGLGGGDPPTRVWTFGKLIASIGGFRSG